MESSPAFHNNLVREKEKKKEEKESGKSEAHQVSVVVIELQLVCLEDHVAFVPEDETLFEDPT